jgi:hypothetical protein
LKYVGVIWSEVLNDTRRAGSADAEVDQARQLVRAPAEELLQLVGGRRTGASPLFEVMPRLGEA